jgi:hypothetical protein
MLLDHVDPGLCSVLSRGMRLRGRTINRVVVSSLTVVACSQLGRIIRVEIGHDAELPEELLRSGRLVRFHGH